MPESDDPVQIACNAASELDASRLGRECDLGNCQKLADLIEGWFRETDSASPPITIAIWHAMGAAQMYGIPKPKTTNELKPEVDKVVARLRRPILPSDYELMCKFCLELCRELGTIARMAKRTT